MRSERGATTSGGALGSPVLAATLAAAAMVAQQVVGKATRDAMFLTHHAAARLPVVMIASALVSGLVVVLTTRLIERRGPARVVPAALVVHALATLLEWAAASRFESVVSIVVYVHTASVGATIVSAFWSVVSEGFDPHTAKQVVGRIGAGAALGGVLGGGLAWAAARVTSVPTMLVVMAALSLACAAALRTFARATEDLRARASAEPSGAPRTTALTQTPYLRLLALVVLLGAATQTLLDYALSVEATAAFGNGPELLSFFAIFQTAVGLMSFLLQLAANRFALERLGVGGTVTLLPVGVVALGALVLGAPSLASVALLRGGESVVRASLFRSAYEVLFTPVPQSMKRPTKIAIDVVFDRLGMILGGALTLGLVAWSAERAMIAATAAAMVTALLQIAVARGVHRGYVATLTDRLLSGTLTLDPAALVDRTTRQTLSHTMEGLDRPRLLAQVAALQAANAERDAPRPQATLEFPDIETSAADERVRILSDLRSGEVATARRALRADPSILLPLSFEILELLARDELARDVTRALAPLVPRITGAILDVVLDRARPRRVRRRAARLLSHASSQRAADGLVEALEADELDVRHTCGQVLSGMREANPSVVFDPGAVNALARRELEEGPSVPPDARRLEHAFNLLSLTFPREPMQLAHGGLSSRDPFLRGVALEYLDAVLPSEVRAALTPHVEGAVTTRPARSDSSRAAGRPSLESLLESKAAILLSVEALRPRDSDTDPPTS